MKKIRLGLIFALGLTAPVASAADWTAIPVVVDSGTVRLDVEWRAVYFVNASRGWIAGDSYRAPDQNNYYTYILRTTNGGASWKLQYEGTGNTFLQMQFTDSLRGWVAGGGTGTRSVRTTDGGQTWAAMPKALGVDFVNARHGWLGANKTTDGGATWAYINGEIGAYGVDFVDSLLGWRAADRTDTSVYKTTDGGNSWTGQWAPGLINVQVIRFFNRSLGWAAARSIELGSGIFKTTNGGASWVKQDTIGNIEGLQALDSLNLVACSRSGLFYRSADGGTTWTREQIPYSGSSRETRIHLLGLDFGYAVVGGTFYRLGTASSILPLPGRRSVRFGLDGNVVRFSPMRAAHLEILLLDARGRRVEILRRKKFDAGAHQVRLPAGIAPGSYVLEMRVDGNRHARKVRIDGT